MRIVILGAPGSGKRTQTGLLAEKYGLPLLTTSELVKQAMAEESERGMQLRLLHQEGQPLTDDIILELLQERLLQADLQGGFVLDGFPRNLLQALTLDELLSELGQSLDLVLLIHIETDALMERLVGRRTCRACGAIYNIYTNPAVVEEICDVCGGRLHQRAEYNEETVSSRLHVFDHLTSPLLSHYGKLEKLLRVDGEGEVDEVFARVHKAIEDFLENRQLQAVAGGEPETQEEMPETLSSEQGGQVTDLDSGAVIGAEANAPQAKRRAATSPKQQTDGELSAKKGNKSTSKVAGGKVGVTKASAKLPVGKPKKSVKKKAVQKQIVQKKVAQKKTVQKKAVQKKAVQKKAVAIQTKKRVAASANKKAVGKTPTAKVGKKSAVQRKKSAKKQSVRKTPSKQASRGQKSKR
jgi:adenylate kinase